MEQDIAAELNGQQMRSSLLVNRQEEAFVKELEARLERALRPQKRGPKPRQAPGENLDLFSGQDIPGN